MKEKLTQFREWQRTPYTFKEVDMATEHTCAACGRTYTGKFCPRCGQAASVGRYSWKRVFKNLIAKWGIGDRSFFRTLRDLLLRPGYAMRDYLKGQQSAYYPPFSMLVIMVACKLITGHWVHVDLAQLWNQFMPPHTPQEAEAINFLLNQHLGQTVLYLLFFVALLLFLFFRRSPNFGKKMRFSELFVALVYLTAVFCLFLMVADCFSLATGSGALYYVIFWLLLPIYMVASFHQLSGYSVGKTILLLLPSPILVYLVIGFSLSAAQGFIAA